MTLAHFALAAGKITGGALAGVTVLVTFFTWCKRHDYWPWRVLRFLTLDQWAYIDRDPGPGSADGPRRADWKVAVILVTACISLTLQEYVGQHDTYERLFPYDPRHLDQYWQLKSFVWWTGWRVFGYLLMPIAVVLALPGERLRDYHLSPAGFFKHLWIYAIMFALILPVVFAASHTQAFRHTYPFYRLANRSLGDLWMWEGMYAMQFLSLEFFFRGFLLQGLRRAFGSGAIFVMVVPYCMIHYGKPLPETFGAIGAGLILGTLAMRTRSIWGGVMIHVGVAWTMDLLAVSHCPVKGPCR
jgi:membrane protease YdiL (CAAX protease family)